MPNRSRSSRLACFLAIALACTSCRPTPTPAAAPAPLPTATAPTVPVAAPAQPSAEGLVICNFEDDLSIWQGYSQDTQTTATGSAAPQGYLNVAGFHAKYADQWVKPTAGLTKSADPVKEGKQSGRWADTVDNNRLVAAQIPHDWSAWQYLTFWAYSEIANKAAVELVAYSETDQTADDDYFKIEIAVDWTGWKLFEIPLKEFAATRNPVGWSKIDYIKLASSGWSHTPNPSTVLYLDAMRLTHTRSGPSLAVELPETRHPNLLLNPAEIDAVKRKMDKHEWARSAYQAIKANAFTWSTRTIEVPKTGGGYYHAGGEDYAITQAHYDLANAARDLALVYQLAGDRAYAAKSREILMAYAGSYLTYEVHDKEGRTGDKASAGGRATAQGINEASWVIPLAWAYDLIYDTLSSGERAQIEKNILRPAAALLMDNNEGRHNHQAWYNAGVGVIGFALGDKEYVWHALYKPDSGLYYQLKKSVTPDGLWYEGSMHYQFYVLQALGPLAEAACHAGIDLYQEPGYRALFDFPLQYAGDTLRLPVINDGREVYLAAPDRSRYYEAALLRTGDARYAGVVQAAERGSLESLVFGVPDLPPAPQPQWRSQNWAASGLTALRAGGVFPQQVVLNRMGYEGGHSHPDRLEIVLSGLGRVLAPDAGSIKYEDPVHTGWYKQSLAHNVLIVDGKTQQRAPMAILEAFLGNADLQVTRASSDKAYPGVKLSRTVAMNGEYVLDVFEASDVSPHTYDWVYHNYGRLASDLEWKTGQAPGKSNGYEYLANVRQAQTASAWRADWSISSDQKVRLTMAGAPGTTVYAAQGPVAAATGDETSPEAVPLVIARRVATTTRYISLIEPYTTTSALQVTPLAASAGPATGLRVQRGQRADVLLLGGGRGLQRFGEYALDGELGWVSLSGDTVEWLYLGAGRKLEGKGWSLELDSLATESGPDKLAVYVRIGAPPRRGVRVQSASTTSSVITWTGLVNRPQVTLVKADGSTAPVKPIETGDNSVRFFMDPGAIYEIAGSAP